MGLSCRAPHIVARARPGLSVLHYFFFGLAFNNSSDEAASQEPNTSCMASKSILIETGEYTVKYINRAAWERNLLAFSQLSGD